MTRVARRGVGLVLSAPSGAGKTSIARSLCAMDPQVVLSISITTRAPRAGERDGADYFFRTQAEFDALVQRGELPEWANVFGRCYGTPPPPVRQPLAKVRDVPFDLHGHGIRHLPPPLPPPAHGRS